MNPWELDEDYLEDFPEPPVKKVKGNVVNTHYGLNNANVGPLVEIPEISVDHFHGESLKSSVFFLTHAHTDHMVGLEGPKFLERLNEKGVTLYTHKLTATFLQAFERYLGGPKGQKELIAKNKIRGLETLKEYKIILKDGERDNYVYVTLLPANHCPGSVMFMFETNTRKPVRILHTGDYRQSVELLKTIPALHMHPKCDDYVKGADNVKKIDHLYIDTTFCTTDYEKTFPDRIQVFKQAIKHIKTYLDETKEKGRPWIYIKFSAKFAHEYIFSMLYDEFGLKTHVPSIKKKIYDSIPVIKAATTADPNYYTPFHFCDNKDCVSGGERLDMKLSSMWYTSSRCTLPVTDKRMSKKERDRQEEMAKFFALLRDEPMPQADPIVRTEKRMNVCYAMHPSLQEIVETIEYLKPAIVTPLVVPFKSSLEEIKFTLREYCKKHIFLYDDYNSRPEMINEPEKPVVIDGIEIFETEFTWGSFVENNEPEVEEKNELKTEETVNINGEKKIDDKKSKEEEELKARKLANQIRIIKGFIDDRKRNALKPEIPQLMPFKVPAAPKRLKVVKPAADPCLLSSVKIRIDEEATGKEKEEKMDTIEEIPKTLEQNDEEICQKLEKSCKIIKKDSSPELSPVLSVQDKEQETGKFFADLKISSLTHAIVCSSDISSHEEIKIETPQGPHIDQERKPEVIVNSIICNNQEEANQSTYHEQKTNYKHRKVFKTRPNANALRRVFRGLFSSDSDSDEETQCRPMQKKKFVSKNVEFEIITIESDSEGSSTDFEEA